MPKGSGCTLPFIFYRNEKKVVCLKYYCPNVDIKHFMETPSKFIDLSKTIEYNVSDPWFMRIKIKHKPHKASYWLIRLFIGLPKELFPQHFTGWADDSIRKMGVHASTHIDAPWHYGPISEGKPAKTVDQIPLDWCYGPGVKIDMRHKQELDPITADDLKEAVQKSGVKIEKGTI